MPGNPLLRAWLTDPDGLATRLKALRVRTGRSGQDFADALGWSPSRVSRIENGRTLPTVDDVHAWAQLGGATPDQTEELAGLVVTAGTVRLPWRHRLGRGRAGLADVYNRLFAETTTCVMVDVAVIPGPLQTVDYATAMLEELAEIYPTDDIPAAVTKRQERARSLNDPDKTFQFIVTESVLRCAPASPAVMVAQLDRVLAASTLPNVEIRVLPARSALPAIPLNSFNVFDDLVIVETFDGEVEHRHDDAAAIYRTALQRLIQASETDDAARRIIRAAQADHAAAATRWSQ